ncbi:MAG: hypothetical protein WD696_08330 [Bryobacteraceae bacterium]
MSLWLAILLFAALAVSAGIHFWSRNREVPGRREQRRREALERTGLNGSGDIIDFRDDTVYYSYEVRGVSYTASQDVSALRDRLPDDPCQLIGDVGLKYLSGNPANSIIVSEYWSGLRRCRPSSDNTTSNRQGD